VLECIIESDNGRVLAEGGEGASMFGARKCAVPPARQKRTFSASDNDGERRAIAALRCPSGARLKYVTSRPPSCKALADATKAGRQLWMHDNVVICTRCGADSVATFSRSGDQPPPNGVAVRSQPRPERYLVQYALLPLAIFDNPSVTLKRLLEGDVAFGVRLHAKACRELRIKQNSDPPIESATQIKTDRFAIAVAIEFAVPRAPGEAYYALAALKGASDTPVYYVCERSSDYSDAPIGSAAMLCSLIAGVDKKPDMNLKFCELSQVDFRYFIDAALSHALSE
jgi:hypothetical protein